MKRQYLLLSIVLFFIAGCGETTKQNKLSPDQTYRAYNQRVIDGISFEDSKTYHSRAMTDKVKAQMQTMKERNGTGFDALLATYSTMLQTAAKCSELTLASEEIDGDTAYLKYDRKETCNGDKVTPEGEQIRMVFESGWKIDENLSVYKGD